MGMTDSLLEQSRAEQSRAEQSRAEQSRAEQSRAEQLNYCFQRVSWIDVLKGLGIIFVAVGHIYSNKTVCNWIYSFHMPLFFWAAGLLYREKDILTDIKRRSQTIVIPYFSFGFIDLIYWQLIERRFRESNMGFMDSFIGLFSGQYDCLDFNVHLWYLPCFFITVVFFNIMMKVAGEKLTYIVSIAMSAVSIFVSLPGFFWGIDRVFKYIGFYAIGHVLAEYKVDKIIVEQRMSLRISVAVIFLTVNFGLSCFNLTTGIFGFITAIVGVTAVMIISLTIDHNRVLQYLGRISLVVLCVHGPVYRVVIKLFSIPLHVSTDVVRANFVLSILVVIMTMAVCCMVYEVVIIILPWMVGKIQRTVLKGKNNSH